MLAAVVAVGVAGRLSVVPSVAAVPSAAAIPAEAAVPAEAGVPAEAAAPLETPNSAPFAMPRRDREEGTDGLMGGIPFGLPNDTPYPRPDAHARDATGPWVRAHAGLMSVADAPRVV